jgi:hypothetical protein
MVSAYRVFESKNSSLNAEFSDILANIPDVAWCVLEAHETILHNIYSNAQTHPTYWEDAVSCAKEYSTLDNATLNSAMRSLTVVHYKMRFLHTRYWRNKDVDYPTQQRGYSPDVSGG